MILTHAIEAPYAWGDNVDHGLNQLTQWVVNLEHSQRLGTKLDCGWKIGTGLDSPNPWIQDRWLKMILQRGYCAFSRKIPIEIYWHRGWYFGIPREISTGIRSKSDWIWRYRRRLIWWRSDYRSPYGDNSDGDQTIELERNLPADPIVDI